MTPEPERIPVCRVCDQPAECRGGFDNEPYCFPCVLKQKDAPTQPYRSVFEWTVGKTGQRRAPSDRVPVHTAGKGRSS